MTEDEHASFPEGLAFLELQKAAFDAAESVTKDFSTSAGVKLPATVENLGSVLSILYRTAYCAWGCGGSSVGVAGWACRESGQRGLQAHSVREL